MALSSEDIVANKLNTFLEKNPNATAEQLRQEQIKAEEQKKIDSGYRLVAGPTRGKYATIVGRKNKTYREMVKLLKKNRKTYPK